MNNNNVNADQDLLRELWQEHLVASFPEGFGGKDVNGIDFDMLDSDIRGCVVVFLDRGTLDAGRVAILGLSYHRCDYILPILNEEGVEYFSRLSHIAEAILKIIIVVEGFADQPKNI